ncbi:MAG TPA: alpha/beta fold hydrolase [Vicinamibacterales bacterium]|nr:alpha/beta fold hydrolase [Vicinamibacterales bacterium]
MAAGSSATYEFGPFRLEVGERRLSCEGRVVPLRTKVFDTLCVLVEHSGRLLTKHELMLSIWPDASVEENNLNHNISTLRRALGEQATGQKYIETVPRVGYRFVADVSYANGGAAALAPAPPAAPARSLRQEIRLCTAKDGTRIAYSTVGTGPPLVKAANWLNHLEYEWESPVWKHWTDAITLHHTFVRYDERGCGLSDWRVQDLSFESFVHDLETVVDALGVERFDLLGISQGGAVAAAYAARHPERIGRLILCGAYACGWKVRGDLREIEGRTALIKLVRLDWGQNNPAFRQVFTTRFIPDAGPEQMEWFNELQHISASPENAARLMEEFSRIDVRALLGGVKAPTIVLHSEGDAAIPFDEGRQLAAGISGARFVPLPSRNHLVLEHERAWPILLRELGEFLGWEVQERAGTARLQRSQATAHGV